MIARTPQYLCAAKNGHPTNETPLSTELARCGSGASADADDALDEPYPAMVERAWLNPNVAPVSRVFHPGVAPR